MDGNRWRNSLDDLLDEVHKSHNRDTSDDLKLSDFIGIEKEENDDLSPSIIVSSHSAGSHSDHPKTSGAEVEGMASTSSTGEESVGGGGGSSHTQNTSNSNRLDSMDFSLIEPDSFHLNVEASKHKTSLRRKGSLARRKRPTRHTISNPTGISCNIYTDSTEISHHVEHVPSDDDDQTESSVADPDGKKQFNPQKVGLMLAGLQDLKKSKLFNQEGRNFEESMSTTSAAGQQWSGQTSRDQHANLTAKAMKTRLNASILSQDITDSSQLGRTDSGSPGASDVTLRSTARQIGVTSQGVVNAPVDYQHRRSSCGVLTFGSKGNSGPGPQEKVPEWLSQLKTKATTTSGSGLEPDGGHSVKRTPSPSSPSESGRLADVRGRETLRKRGTREGLAQKAEAEKKADKPEWMRTAQDKTSRMATKLQAERAGKEGYTPTGVKSEQHVSSFSQHPDPSTTSGVNGSPANVTQTPSNLFPSRGGAEKGAATNGSAAVVWGKSERLGEIDNTPRWKLELAEMNKRRQSQPQESYGSSSDKIRSPSTSPTWKEQLQQRKASMGTYSDRRERETGSRGVGSSNSSSPDWTKLAEERRARLMKSGLLTNEISRNH